MPNPEETNMTPPQETVPVMPPVQEPLPPVEPPVPPVEEPAAVGDMSGYNSCFRCGREKAGRVTLIQVGGELLCNYCV